MTQKEELKVEPLEKKVEAILTEHRVGLVSEPNDFIGYICKQKLMDLLTTSQEALLERLLKNGHGGGNFRRLIEQERQALRRK